MCLFSAPFTAKIQKWHRKTLKQVWKAEMKVGMNFQIIKWEIVIHMTSQVRMTTTQ